MTMIESEDVMDVHPHSGYSHRHDKSIRGCLHHHDHHGTIKGHYIRTEDVGKTGQLFLPRLIQDLNAVYKFGLEIISDHILHADGDIFASQMKANFIVAPSSGRRDEVYAMLERSAMWAGIEKVDEIPRSALD